MIEVLSKGTEKLDRGAKRVVYARSGVEELWLVDREKREVAVYRFAESVNEPVIAFRGLEMKFSLPVFINDTISVELVVREKTEARA